MTSFAKSSFAYGEVSPALYARVDTNQYQMGLRTLRNMTVMRSGGSKNRSGTKFVAEVKDSSKAVRLIPFVFSDSLTYVCEFGDLYVRFHQNGAQVTLTAQNITSVTSANPAVLTYSGTDTYANGDEIYISGVAGAMGAFLNGRNFKVANLNAGANTFSLQYMDGATNVDSRAIGYYTSGGTVAEVYTVTTTIAEASLPYLSFTQNADRLTISGSGSVAIEAELIRTAHTSWSFSTPTFSPEMPAPSGTPTITNSGAVTPANNYVISAIDSVTGEESLVSTSTGNLQVTYPATLTWNSVAGASKYYIYFSSAGENSSHWIAESPTTSFVITSTSVPPQVRGRIPVLSNFGPTDTYSVSVPPIGGDTIAMTNNVTKAAGYFQQRSVYGLGEQLAFSFIGMPKSFWVPFNVPSNGPIGISFSGRKVNEIRHILEIDGKLLVFTNSGEWFVYGDANEAVSPTSINARPFSYNGCAYYPRPLPINNTVLYVQANGSVIRDLGSDSQVDGQRGNDLTQTSNHLVDGYTIKDWDLQRVPDPTVWIVRSDGKFPSLTYVREQQMVSWARHDTDGLVENVCVVPEGTQDAVYFAVKRTISGLSALGGSTRRYVERMTTRRSIAEPRSALTSLDTAVDTTNAVFMDSFLSYDGRNTSASHTMTLSGGSSWIYTEDLTLTSSASFFASTDVGNAIFLYTVDSAGTVTDQVRCTIKSYTSDTAVTVNPHKTVPAAFRASAIKAWAKAVDELGGLWHLEGEEIAVLGDDFVIASPNNGGGLTVSNGVVTMPAPHSVNFAGLPFISDFETLDIDFSQSETRMDKKKLINKVTLYLNNSRGFWAGASAPTGTDPLENLREDLPRNIGDGSMDNPPNRVTGPHSVIIKSGWSEGGRVFIRQVDPLPLEILAAVPTGMVT